MLDVEKKLAELEKEISVLLEQEQEELEEEKKAKSKAEKTRAKIVSKEREIKLFDTFREVLQAQAEEYAAELNDLRQECASKDDKLREQLHTLRVKALNGSGITSDEIDTIAIEQDIDLDADLQPQALAGAT